jgi:RNA polymerase sigma-70 factor (ECF subfamily)
MPTVPRIQDPAGDERSDLLLLDRVRAGDAEAFETLFRKWVERLCAFAHSYVDHDIAEEVIQDLFCWLWEHRHTIEMPRDLRAYLFAAVRNRSLNARRHQRLAFALHERLSRHSNVAESIDTRATAEAEVMASDLADAVARLVRSMPPRSREVFTLVRDMNMSNAAVAQILHISTKTVENHMTRALAFLRARLGPWLRP